MRTKNITLTWTDTNEIEKGYRVYRNFNSPVDTANPSQLLATLDKDATQYVDEDVVFNDPATDTYYYIVSAFIDNEEQYTGPVLGEIEFIATPTITTTNDISFSSGDEVIFSEFSGRSTTQNSVNLNVFDSNTDEFLDSYRILGEGNAIPVYFGENLVNRDIYFTGFYSGDNVDSDPSNILSVRTNSSFQYGLYAAYSNNIDYITPEGIIANTMTVEFPISAFDVYQGDIYYVSGEFNGVRKFNPRTGEEVIYHESNTFWAHITISLQGDIFVTRGNLYEFIKNDFSVVDRNTFNVTGNYRTLFSPNSDKVYYATGPAGGRNPRGIYEYDIVSGIRTLIIPISGSFNNDEAELFGVSSLNQDGSYYVFGGSSNRSRGSEVFVQINPDNTTQTLFSQSTMRVFSGMFDRNGVAYTTRLRFASGDGILKYDNTGLLVSNTSGLSDPQQVIAEPTGKVYIRNSLGVAEIDSTTLDIVWQLNYNSLSYVRCTCGESVSTFGI